MLQETNVDKRKTYTVSVLIKTVSLKIMRTNYLDFLSNKVYRMADTKVVFSFTTSPQRIHKCGEMIRSLLTQSVKADLILLNIPKVFKRTGEFYKIPKDLKKQIKVNVIKHDYGPGTKIVPTVSYLRESNWDEDTIIIYGDDDIRYLPRMIEVYKEQTSDAVWCVSGFNFIDFQILGSRGHKDNVSIAEGYGSVCTRLSFFGTDFEPYMYKWSEVDDLKFSDDVTISNYLWRKNIPIHVCNIENKLSFALLWKSQSILSYGNESDALHNGASGITSNNTDRYKRVISILTADNERYFPVYVLGEEERQKLRRVLAHK